MLAENDMEEEAIDAIEQAIKLTNAFRGEHYHNYGKILFKFEKYRKALEIFEKSIKEHAMVDEIYLFLGKCYMFLEEYDEAFEYLKRAKAVFSDRIEQYQSTNSKKNEQEKKRYKELLDEANFHIENGLGVLLCLYFRDNIKYWRD